MQRCSAVAKQPNLDWKSQPNLLGIDVDLYSTRLVGFGHEFNIRKRASYDQDGVAAFHCFLRGTCTEQSNRSGGIWAVIRKNGPAEKRLHYWRSHEFRNLLQLGSGREGTLASQNDRPFTGVQNLRRTMEERRRR